jgi:hypothetical protein
MSHEAFGEARVGLDDGRLVLQLGRHHADLSRWHDDTFELAWRWPEPYRQFRIFQFGAEGLRDRLVVERLGTFTRTPNPAGS